MYQYSHVYKFHISVSGKDRSTDIYICIARVSLQLSLSYKQNCIIFENPLAFFETASPIKGRETYAFPEWLRSNDQDYRHAHFRFNYFNIATDLRLYQSEIFYMVVTTHVQDFLYKYYYFVFPDFSVCLSISMSVYSSVRTLQMFLLP